MARGWVILALLFLSQNVGVHGLDLPVFSCEDMENKCKAPGNYACSERSREKHCTNSKMIEESSPVDLSSCRMKCHFAAKCGSYVWSAATASCGLCEQTALQRDKVLQWDAPIEGQSGEARLVEWGVHHGKLLEFGVAGIDYISKGYISIDPSLFTTETTLVAGSAEHVQLKFKGPFCVRLPSATEWSRNGERSKKKFNFVWILWIAGSLALIALASRAGKIRRTFLYLKHRASVRYM